MIFSSTGVFSQNNSLNPQINIPDSIVKNFDGAYSVITIDDSGEAQQFNVRFKQGQITSVVLNGEEIPKEEWENKEKFILDQIRHLEAKHPKNYKYHEVYRLEEDLRRNIENLEKSLQELEISKRLDKFYEGELKSWMNSLEDELNKSDFVKEVESILDDLILELDRFISERKEFQQEKN